MKKAIAVSLLIVGGVILLTDNPVSARMPVMYDSNPGTYDELIKRISADYGVPLNLTLAIIRQESNFRADALNPSDPSAGLMQTTPATASAMLGRVVTLENLKDPATAITAGVKYLAHLIHRYHDMDAVIQMYNLGETKYNKGYRVPSYLASVKKYMDFYA